MATIAALPAWWPLPQGGEGRSRRGHFFPTGRGGDFFPCVTCNDFQLLRDIQIRIHRRDLFPSGGSGEFIAGAIRVAFELLSRLKHRFFSFGGGVRSAIRIGKMKRDHHRPYQHDRHRCRRNNFSFFSIFRHSSNGMKAQNLSDCSKFHSKRWWQVSPV